MSWGTLRCPGGIFWAIQLFILRQNLTQYIEIKYYYIWLHDAFNAAKPSNQLKDDKNEQRYFDVPFRCGAFVYQNG